MITIDRTSGKSVVEQIADQLRFLIASGRYAEGDDLPSTRLLARQIDVSFHTVRAAYQQLAGDGTLRAVPGSGYSVAKRIPLKKEERLERGAAIAHEALLRLTALGLSENEISYLFDEQRALLDAGADQPRVLASSPSLDIAERFADQLLERLQIDAEAVPLEHLTRHADADVVIVPFAMTRDVKALLPGVEVHGVEYSLGSSILEIASTLLPDRSLGLVVRHASSVRHLVDDIRSASGFSGDVIASVIDVDPTEMVSRFSTCEVVALSPAIRRRVPGALRRANKLVMIDGGLNEESLARVRSLIPR